jgi:pyrroloquinoline quinone (PQQ) biosynthesis protein C
MNLFERLQKETVSERNYLTSSPIIKRCFDGEVSVEDYVKFLTQAYHHVKHTVPLLMNVGAKLPESKEWLREAVAEYIEEELGHQEWILNDIAVCGFDKEVIRKSKPNFTTELMVSYAYDSVNRVSPLKFFGMVHVLEGTSIALADNAADVIESKLALPKNAFSYLKSHGALDIEHVKFFENLMYKITDKNEQDIIVESAKRFYVLYANIFRSLDEQGKLISEEAAHAA